MAFGSNLSPLIAVYGRKGDYIWLTLPSDNHELNEQIVYISYIYIVCMQVIHNTTVRRSYREQIQISQCNGMLQEF